MGRIEALHGVLGFVARELPCLIVRFLLERHNSFQISNRSRL